MITKTLTINVILKGLWKKEVNSDLFHTGCTNPGTLPLFVSENHVIWSFAGP